MKKITLTAILIALVFALAACGVAAPEETTAPATTDTQAPSTAPTTLPRETMPTIIPTMPTVETNIPDPEVDTSMGGEETEDSAPEAPLQRRR